MIEPFKNWLGRAAICGMADHLARVAPDFHETGFDDYGFIAYATYGLDDLELKQRSNRICDALERYLPNDFQTAANILVASLEPSSDISLSDMETGITQQGIRGWPVAPMADYIARRGQHDVALSLGVLKEMTTRSSSEFAIRPFLDNHTQTTLKIITPWCRDDNEHVRRLVSEDTRPRLPWGMRLHQFVKDPAPVVTLLERLRDDPSEYVRRSVANNLNDMAKDHADMVADLAQRWIRDAPPERARLIRHGLRTLIKAGHPGALAALGYGPARIALARFEILTPAITLGGAVEFSLALSSTAKSNQPLIIDYAVHHMRANGRATPKVFKWKTVTLKPGEILNATRRHAIRPITTRRYYPGQHRVEVLINGHVFGGADFDLKTE